jgi:hypothetical integral membrane protein (TIGR02206 family)
MLWIMLGRKARTALQQQRIGLAMTCVGTFSWLYAEALMFGTDQAPVQSTVPLHLCYFLNFLLPVMVWLRSFKIFDIVYPIVMAGCLQALLTPDLTQAFPHYTNIRYWLVHITLVQSVLYAIFVYRFTPTPWSILKCALFLNLYALFVVPFNWWLDTNFLYLRAPARGSLMEWFGPWPWYLLHLEWLMLVLFTVVCAPFLWRKRYRRFSTQNPVES